MKEQLLKMSGTDVLSSRKKLRKTLRGGGVGIQIAQPLKNKTVRAEVDLTNKTYIDNNTRFSHPYGHLGHYFKI